MKNGKTHALDETLDALLGGAIQLYQSRPGYRFSLDAVLLAHFVTVKQRDRIVDLGAGNGAVALMLALLHPTARLLGIEIQPAMLERARRNVALNGLEERVKMHAGDVRALPTLGAPATFDAVVCNPPYRTPLSGRVSPNPERRMARHEFEGALIHFVQAGSFLLKSKGRLALVYPAVRSVEVLGAMRAGGIEPKRLRMVHSSERSPASLILTEGVKGGKSEITVEAPLLVYDRERHYSGEVSRMLRGSVKERV
jgi:tRNA1Val (adenine37-N6)-methyltransferase